VGVFSNTQTVVPSLARPDGIRTRHRRTVERWQAALILLFPPATVHQRAASSHVRFSWFSYRHTAPSCTQSDHCNPHYHIPLNIIEYTALSNTFHLATDYAPHNRAQPVRRRHAAQLTSNSLIKPLSQPRFCLHSLTFSSPGSSDTQRLYLLPPDVVISRASNLWRKRGQG
jgi:hypothetical protein